MSVNAISGVNGVGVVQPVGSSPAVPGSADQPAQAQPLPTGLAQPPLSPEVLSGLLGQDFSSYGSFYGG